MFIICFFPFTLDANFLHYIIKSVRQSVNATRRCVSIKKPYKKLKNLHAKPKSRSNNETLRAHLIDLLHPFKFNSDKLGMILIPPMSISP